MKAKELVTLSSRPIKGDVQSLFLVYYVRGERVRESLGMYIVPERTRLDRIKNQETMKAAEAVKAQRIIELQNNKAGLVADRSGLLFTIYLDQQSQRYRNNGKKFYLTCDKLKSWVEAYNPAITMGMLDKEFVKDFIQFISRSGATYARKAKRLHTSRPLAPSTIYMYYRSLAIILNNAVRDEIIASSPIKHVARTDAPRKPETEREYLTIEELRMMAETDYSATENQDIVKRAFLFSCFTGLRISDVRALRWCDVREVYGGTEIVLRQIKTKKLAHVPLSQNAIDTLPERGDARPEDNVFRNFPHPSTINLNLRKWAKKAGVNKYISFHCARHTYATLLLTYGADLYTVSKLLGHSNIGVTEVYAKIIDEKRREATNLIPKI